WSRWDLFKIVSWSGDGSGCSAASPETGIGLFGLVLGVEVVLGTVVAGRDPGVAVGDLSVPEVIEVQGDDGGVVDLLHWPRRGPHGLGVDDDLSVGIQQLHQMNRGFPGPARGPDRIQNAPGVGGVREMDGRAPIAVG